MDELARIAPVKEGIIETRYAGLIRVAEEIAPVILENSYRRIAKDVILFGRLARGEAEPESDIDLLLIHRDPKLRELGAAVIYDPEKGAIVADGEARIDWQGPAGKEAMGVKLVLNLLGGRKFESDDYARNDLYEWYRQTYRAQGVESGLDTSFLSALHAAYSALVPNEFKEGLSEQELDSFSGQEGFKKFLDAVDAYVVRASVDGKVRKILTTNGLDIEKDLDTLVLFQGLLNPEESHDERALLVTQARDPTFWQTILGEGRVYNLGTGKFDTPVEQRYPGAVEAFKPA